jgi:predicted DNA-binding transcriptional regulator AlpA
MSDPIVDALERIEAAARAASIPLALRWLDASGVAAMLGYAPRYVAERLACRVDFPQPMRVDGKGDPRWRAVDIQTWAEAQRERGVRRSVRRSRGNKSTASSDPDGPQSSPA